MTRSMRQAAISRIIQHSNIENHEQLRSELERLGFDVAQSTVSRDLREMGLKRVRNSRGLLVYTGETAQNPEREALPRKIRDFMVDIAASGNILVLRTAPGNAQPLAAALDRATLPEVLGTLAGDDTIFAVLAAGVDGNAMRHRLLAMTDTAASGRSGKRSGS